jgi:hypothetical protein
MMMDALRKVELVSKKTYDQENNDLFYFLYVKGLVMLLDLSDVGVNKKK